MSLRLRISFFFATIAVALSANGSTEGHPFQTGIEAYEQGDYEAAETSFINAVETDESSAARHNLGLTLLQLDQPAQAVWQLERSLLLDPFNRDYRKKLNLIRTQLGLGERTLPGYLWLSQIASIHSWIIIATISFWLLLALLLLPRLNGRKTSGRIKLLSLLNLLILVLALTATGLNFKTLKTGIVLAKETTALRAAPASAAPESGFARPGERAHIIDRHNNFYRIRTEDSATGWISTNNFRLLIN